MYKNGNYLCILTINPKNSNYKPKKIPTINLKNLNPIKILYLIKNYNGKDKGKKFRVF